MQIRWFAMRSARTEVLLENCMHLKRRREINWSLEMKPGYEQGGINGYMQCVI